MNEYQEISPGVCVDNYQNRVDCKTGKIIPYTPPSVPNTAINSAFSTFGNQNTLSGTSDENSVFSNNTFNPSINIQSNLPTAPVNPEISKYYKIDDAQKGVINNPSINTINNKASISSNSKYYPYIAPIAALNTGLAYFSELTRQNRSKQYEQNNLSNPYNGILGYNTAKQTYDVSGSPFTNYYNYKKGGMIKYAEGGERENSGFCFDEKGNKIPCPQGVKNGTKVFDNPIKFKQAQQNYNDSLSLYNNYKAKDIVYNDLAKKYNLKTWKDNNAIEHGRKIQPISSQGFVYSQAADADVNADNVPDFLINKFGKETQIMSDNKSISNIFKGSRYGSNLHGYKKPTQPVVLQKEQEYPLVDKSIYKPKLKPAKITVPEMVTDEVIQTTVQSTPKKDFNYIYGPSNSVIGKSYNDGVFEPVNIPEQRGSVNKADLDLLNNPDELKKYITSKGLKFKKGGIAKFYEGGDYLDEYLDSYLNEDDSKKKTKIDNSAPSEEELEAAKESEQNDLWQQYNNDLANSTLSLYGDRKRNKDAEEESYSGQNATIAPNDAINSVAAYYMNKGYDKSFVAGVLGNIHAESNGKSTANELNPTSGKGGYGLFQHTGSRRKNLFNFAKKNSLDPSDPLTQAMFAETEPEFKKAYSKSRGSSPEESARIFENTFEKPVIKRSKVRVSAASQFYPLLK